MNLSSCIVFGRFPAELGRETRPDRSGSTTSGAAAPKTRPGDQFEGRFVTISCLTTETKNLKPKHERYSVMFPVGGGRDEHKKTRMPKDSQAHSTGHAVKKSPLGSRTKAFTTTDAPDSFM